VAAAESFPLLIKMNCQDFAENGLSLEDSLLSFVAILPHLGWTSRRRTPQIMAGSI
jgi:hypothetical protein